METDDIDEVFKYPCDVPGNNLDSASDWLEENHPESHVLFYKKSKTMYATRTGQPASYGEIFTFGFTSEEIMIECKLRFG